MTVFIALLLVVATFAFVVYPLIKRKPPSAGSAEGGRLGELHSKRDTIYAMLKELEFDFQSGILTEEDYRDLEARYKSKAISVLKGMDDLEKGSQPEAEVEAEIEKQVLKLRRGKEGQPEAEVEAEIEKQVLKLRRGKDRFCTQCGARRRESDRFCSSCGASLSQGGRVD
jgi:hypothetical protein